MKNVVVGVLLAAAVLIPVAIFAQPRPGNPTTATVITKAEIDKISASEQSANTMDQNARVMDIGDHWSMEVGVIHRGKQHVQTVAEANAAPPAPARGNAAAGAGNAAAGGRGAAGGANAQAAAAPVACGQQMANPPGDALHGAITHDFQTEGYLIVSGSGTAFIDGTLVNGRHSNSNADGGPNGPGCGGGVAVGSRKVELKVGDILIVPPGVIHGWYDIPDHVDYLSFRPSHDTMKNGWVNPTIAK
jgi:mannose-6-phosphate isomerase-like protein (cupin superfamily)